MKSNIFIPKKLLVGYQNRSGTYTGKLAYVIYIDHTGKIRKEASWKSWKDDKIETDEFENIAQEGFVLNKKVGDYKSDWSDWNHRQAYCRIYDPRGFEFEITIENLLYILENTNSIKGKGLEGKFIYGWEGKDLVLIPESSPEYDEMIEFTSIQSLSVPKADLTPGFKYKTNKNEIQTYLGYFYEYDRWWRGQSKTALERRSSKKKHWFSQEGSLMTYSGYKHLVQKLELDENFPFLMDKLESSDRYTPVVDAYLAEISIDDLKNYAKSGEYLYCFVLNSGKYYEFRIGILTFRIGIDTEIPDSMDVRGKYYYETPGACMGGEYASRKYVSYQHSGLIDLSQNKYFVIKLRFENGKESIYS